MKTWRALLAVLALGIGGCGKASHPPEDPSAPGQNDASSSLEHAGCSLEVPGRWRIESRGEPGAEGIVWEAHSEDGESQLMVSVLETDPAKSAPDREAVDAVLGLRQDAELMRSEEPVTFSERYFDDDPQVPGGFYSSERAGIEPMLTMVRWARGRTCLFLATGRWVQDSVPKDLGVTLLARAKAEPLAK